VQVFPLGKDVLFIIVFTLTLITFFYPLEGYGRYPETIKKGEKYVRRSDDWRYQFSDIPVEKYPLYISLKVVIISLLPFSTYLI